MGYERIIICEVCGKREILDNPIRNEWYIENISHQICSEECFDKKYNSDNLHIIQFYQGSENNNENV